MRLWENWPCMGLFIVIAITIVGIILGVEKNKEQNKNETRPKRSVTPRTDPCGAKYGGIMLNYPTGSSTSFIFDLCDVINCGGYNQSYRGYDLYLCAPPTIVDDCENNRTPYIIGVCSDWGQVTKVTGSWTPDPHYLANAHKVWWSKVSFQRDYSSLQNPITLSVTGVDKSSYGGNKAYFFPRSGSNR